MPAHPPPPQFFDFWLFSGFSCKSTYQEDKYFLAINAIHFNATENFFYPPKWNFKHFCRKKSETMENGAKMKRCRHSLLSIFAKPSDVSSISKRHWIFSINNRPKFILDVPFCLLFRKKAFSVEGFSDKSRISD